MRQPERTPRKALIPALWVIGVLLAAIVPYLSSLRGDFVLDDQSFILDDPLSRSLAHFPKTLLTGFVPRVFGYDIAYYRPMITASYQADFMIDGANPFVFRLTNLLLHALAALLVFLLARRMTKSLTAAGIAGILFGCLPSHAEAVAWVSGRTDIISTVFVLAAVLVFAAARERQSFSWPLAAGCGGLWLLSLLSKETAFALPLMLAGYAWASQTPARPREARKWVLVLAVPLIVCLLLRRHAVHAAVVHHISFMLGPRLLGIGIAYAAYLRIMFLPRVGQVVYDVFPIGMKYPLIALAMWLVPIGLVVAAVKARRRLPVVSFGALWVFAALLPVVNILPTSSQVPSERFVYLASVGSCLIVGWLAWRMLEWRPRGMQAWPVLGAALVCWFVLYCAALAVAGSQIYFSNVAWAKEVASENKRFYRTWAASYFLDAGMFKEAVREYEAAARHEKDARYSYSEIGRLLCLLGEPARAVEAMKEATRRYPKSAVLQFRLGIALAGSGDIASAASAFERSVRIDPGHAAAWRNLAKADLKLQRYPEAVAAYKRAFALAKPTQADRLDYERACKAAGMEPRHE